MTATTTIPRSALFLTDRCSWDWQMRVLHCATMGHVYEVTALASEYWDPAVAFGVLVWD